jgi:hypothetical protein
VNFSLIAHAIATLETKNVSINDSMQIFESVVRKLKLVSGQVGCVVKKKLIPLLKKIQAILIFRQSMI